MLPTNSSYKSCALGSNALQVPLTFSGGCQFKVAQLTKINYERLFIADLSLIYTGKLLLQSLRDQ